MDVAELIIIEILIFIVVWAIIFGIPSAWLASQRGRSAFDWLFVGAVFGPAAVLMVGLAPVLPEGRYKPCVECMEPVRLAATTCPHCGEDLEPN